MFLTIVEIIIALVIFCVLVVGVYILIQGDAVVRLLTKQRTEAVLDKNLDGRADFSLEVPFENAGKQEATMLDAYMRIYLPQEQYSDVLLRGKVNLKGSLRDDDYFEAMLIPAGSSKKFLLRFEAYARNGKSITEALQEIPDVDVALFADCRGRRELYTVKEVFTLSAAEIRSLIK